LNIAVTGASGFIGLEVSHFLAERNHKLRLFVPRGIKRERKQILKDCGELYFISPNKPFDFKGIEIVIHLAGRKNGSAKDLYKSNILLSSNVIDEFIFRKCTKLVFTSSYLIYAQSKGRLNEGSPIAPRNLYAATKVITETEIRNRLSRDNFIIARLSHIFGVNKTGYFSDDVLTKMIISSLSKKEFIFTGNPVLDFLDVQNCARYLVTLAESQDFAGYVNVGSGYRIALRQLWGIVKQVIPDRKIYNIKMIINNSSEYYNSIVLNVNRLRNILVEKKSYNLKEEIKRVYTSMKEHFHGSKSS
jgi:dTDP-glucose 4,6-dehydratase